MLTHRYAKIRTMISNDNYVLQHGIKIVILESSLQEK